MKGSEDSQGSRRCWGSPWLGHVTGLEDFEYEGSFGEEDLL